MYRTSDGQVGTEPCVICGTETLTENFKGKAQCPRCLSLMRLAPDFVVKSTREAWMIDRLAVRNAARLLPALVKCGCVECIGKFAERMDLIVAGIVTTTAIPTGAVGTQAWTMDQVARYGSE